MKASSVTGNENGAKTPLIGKQKAAKAQTNSVFREPTRAEKLREKIEFAMDGLKQPLKEKMP